MLFEMGLDGGYGRSKQGRLSSQHSLPLQPRVRTDVDLAGKEYLAASPSRLLPPGGTLRHEGLPFGLISLDQALLGTLDGKSQAVQVRPGR